MSRNIFSDEAFAAWLEKQPAKSKYSYQSTTYCLINQYLTAAGVKVMSVNESAWTGLDWQDHMLPEGWDAVCIGTASFSRDGDKPHRSWTYGGALARLRKHMKETA